jgi:hypothetical protein
LRFLRVHAHLFRFPGSRARSQRPDWPQGAGIHNRCPARTWSVSIRFASRMALHANSVPPRDPVEGLARLHLVRARRRPPARGGTLRRRGARGGDRQHVAHPQALPVDVRVQRAQLRHRDPVRPRDPVEGLPRGDRMRGRAARGRGGLEGGGFARWRRLRRGRRFHGGRRSDGGGRAACGDGEEDALPLPQPLAVQQRVEGAELRGGHAVPIGDRVEGLARGGGVPRRPRVLRRSGGRTRDRRGGDGGAGAHPHHLAARRARHHAAGGLDGERLRPPLLERGGPEEVDDGRGVGALDHQLRGVGLRGGRDGAEPERERGGDHPGGGGRKGTDLHRWGGRYSGSRRGGGALRPLATNPPFSRSARREAMSSPAAHVDTAPRGGEVSPPPRGARGRRPRHAPRSTSRRGC